MEVRWRWALGLSFFIWVVTLLLGYYIMNGVISHATPDMSANTGLVEPAPFWVLVRTNGLVWLVLLSGMFTGGATTIVCLGYNGFQLGMFIAYASRLFGWHWTFRAVIVHGIPEVGGLVLAGAAGLMGASWIWYVIQEQPIPWTNLGRMAAIRAVVSGTLILMGACLETLLTPRVLG